MITILIPFYNREKLLQETLDSIERQTYKDWKVTFYDDGSKDNSIEIAERFAMKYPGTKIIQGQENMGVGYARNILLDSVDTDYACWQDSDDVSHKDRLWFLVRQLKFQPVVFSYMRFFWEIPGKVVSKPYTVDISRYTSREGLYQNMCFASTGFTKAIAQKYKFEHRRTREDVLWLTAMIKDKVTFGVVKKDLYWVRRHKNRTTVLTATDPKYIEINSRGADA